MGAVLLVRLLVPAVIALFFRFVREPSRRLALTLAAAGMSLAFVHPTYALFVALPLAGFALARLLVVGEDTRRSAACSRSACRCCSSSPGSSRSWPRRARTTRAHPSAPVAQVRDRPGRPLAGQLSPRARRGRADGSCRGSGARADAAGRARRAPALERVGCTNPVSCREAVFVDEASEAIAAGDVVWSGRAGGR
jgi:hypothetical protein